MTWELEPLDCKKVSIYLISRRLNKSDTTVLFPNSTASEIKGNIIKVKTYNVIKIPVRQKPLSFIYNTLKKHTQRAFFPAG